MHPSDYFLKPRTPAQKQFCALAAYFKDGLSAREVAEMYGYTVSAFYSLVNQFSRKMKEGGTEDPFFKQKSRGRRKKVDKPHMERTVVALRNYDFSNGQIARAMRMLEYTISTVEIWRILSSRGYAKMPRRSSHAIARAEAVLADRSHLARTVGERPAA